MCLKEAQAMRRLNTRPNFSVAQYSFLSSLSAKAQNIASYRMAASP